jgi:uncharacterized protein with HEPN domain
MLYMSRAAQRFVGTMSRDELAGDEVVGFATLRALEVLGEAAKRVPRSFRSEHPEVPWRGIAGTRDKLIHAYELVDWDVVWDTVTNDLPSLEQTLVQLLDED